MREVYVSNRVEHLVAALAEILGEPVPGRVLSGPASAEIIVVQSRGMERWLSMRLAEIHGVCANVEFPFPRKVIEDAIGIGARAPGRAEEAQTQIRASRQFDPRRLAWPIAAILEQDLDTPEFEVLRRYLREQSVRSDAVLALSRRIATVFDDYIVYRPELVLAWDRWTGHTAVSQGDSPDQVSGFGEGDPRFGPAWQRELWRRLGDRIGRGGHLAGRAQVLNDPDRIRHAIEASDFPSRISLFGMSALPPLYDQAFEDISELVDVRQFMLSPSPALWHASSTPADLPPLLLSCGRVAGQQAEGFRQRSEAYVLSGPLPDPSGSEVERDATNARPGGTVGQGSCRKPGMQASLFTRVKGESDSTLRRLQNTLLGRTSLRADGQEDPVLQEGDRAQRSSEPDQSIQVHACHGRLREVEVLRDQLLGTFEGSPDLRPDQIVVMTPDIEAYAPYIEAVFGERKQAGQDHNSSQSNSISNSKLSKTTEESASSPRIAYRIADRAPRSRYTVWVAVDAIMSLVQGRFEAPDVSDLISLPLIRRRFGLSSRDLDLVLEWLDETQIRWGIDAEHRGAKDQPRLGGNTWRFGLNRLLLGYAMPGENQRFFEDVLPYDHIEGEATKVLGNLAELCETLFDLAERTKEPLKIEAWQAIIAETLDSLIVRDAENTWQHRLIEDALVKILSDAREAGHDSPLSFEMLRQSIDIAIEEDSQAHGFLSNGITFCALLPMRSIPFEVVALLGMSAEEFPRIGRPAGFDLIAQFPEKGDKRVRDDDRHLFLEAILAARQRLIISYVGQDIQSGVRRQPSILVGELLEAIDAQSQMGDSSSAIVWHPIQPFSPRYFRADSSLESYEARRLSEAQALQALWNTEQQAPAQPFFQVNEAEGEETIRRGLASDLSDADRPDADPSDFDRSSSTITLDQFIAFWRAPQAQFLRSVFGLYLHDRDPILESRELLHPDALEAWKIRDALLERLLAGHPLEQIQRELNAAGRLALGVPGKLYFKEDAKSAQQIIERMEALKKGDPLETIDFELRLGDISLKGVLDQLWTNARLEAGMSKLRGPKILIPWLKHLLLSAHRERSDIPLPTQTWLIGAPDPKDGLTKARKAGALLFDAIEPDVALDRLSALVEIYQLGQSTVLPFFKRASAAYAEALAKNPSGSQARIKARKVFEEDRKPTPDLGDVYIQQALGDMDFDAVLAHRWPVGLDFESLALRVYEPLLAAESELEI